ncbi:MAG: hypothetical protein ACJ71Z_04470 [Aeromicrobium sp.]
MTTTPSEPTEGGEFPPDPGLEPTEPTEPGNDDRPVDDEADEDS